MSSPPVPPQFSASVETGAGGVRVRFAGELDLATVADAEAAVARARRERQGPLRIDLSAVTFLDSSGLRLIVQVARACEADGSELSIVPGPHGVQRVFSLAGVLEVLPFAPDQR